MIYRLLVSFWAGCRQICLVGALIGVVASGVAEADSNFPGREPDRKTIKVQQKVDALFESGKYERAFFIYREDLAPVGDKFAQYMVGYMYLTGKGVEQDVPAAAAWYRLAAEREEQSYIKARDEVYAILDEQQMEQANQVYRDLRRDFSDIALLSTMIRNDIDIMRRYTMSMPNAQRDFAQTFDNRRPVYVPVAERLQNRIDYLVNLTVSHEYLDLEEQRRVEQLFAEVTQELDKFDEMK